MNDLVQTSSSTQKNAKQFQSLKNHSLKYIIDIRLFGSITMLCGIDNIMQNIFHISYRTWGIFYIILSVPHNIVMDMNNVMSQSWDRVHFVGAQYLHV